MVRSSNHGGTPGDEAGSKNTCNLVPRVFSTIAEERTRLEITDNRPTEVVEINKKIGFLLESEYTLKSP